MGEITKLVANRQSNASVVIAALEVHAKVSAADVSAVLFSRGEPRRAHRARQICTAALRTCLCAPTNLK
jgi:hypothetical protein